MCILRKLCIYFAIFVICIALTIISTIFDNTVLAIIGIIAEITLGYLITLAFDKINTNGQGLTLLCQSLKYYNKDIRLSFSYLFRIQVEGKYLLVKGNRLKKQYQPIGGVYKYYDEAKPQLEKFQYRADTKMGNTDETDDLRIIIKGKYLLKYMDWFLSMSDREYDPYREFKEELLDTQLLPSQEFQILKYRKVLTHNKGVQFSKYLNCDEFVYADIFEIKLTTNQEEAIKKAVVKNPDQLCLATADELKSECYNGIDKNIGNNAKWLIGE